MKAEVDLIIDEDEAYKEEIFQAEKGMLEMRKPNVWNTNIVGNMEVETEVEFEKFLVSLSEYTNENLEEITVFRFYALIDLLKEKNKDNGSNN